VGLGGWVIGICGFFWGLGLGFCFLLLLGHFGKHFGRIQRHCVGARGGDAVFHKIGDGVGGDVVDICERGEEEDSRWLLGCGERRIVGGNGQVAGGEHHSLKRN